MGTACSPCKGNLAVAVIAIVKGFLTLCGSRGMDWQPGKAPTLQQVGWAPANSNPMLDWGKKQKDDDFFERTNNSNNKLHAKCVDTTLQSWTAGVQV